MSIQSQSTQSQSTQSKPIRPKNMIEINREQKFYNSIIRAITLGFGRVGYELKAYFRLFDSVFFTFLFPVLMLVIFASAFSSQTFGEIPGQSEGLSAAAYYLPGMIAAGILLSGLQNLGIDIAIERSDGTLKRLAGSPLPVLSYFIGKFGQVFVTGLLQTALLLAVAVFGFQVQLPNQVENWLNFAWIFGLGILTSALLGIAISRLPRSGKSASAVILPPVLLLQFISGVYLAFFMLPEWLQNIAAVFPLKWLAQGVRSVFLPDSFKQLEVAGDWELGTVAWVLGAWFVLGLLLSVLTFRWIRKDS